MDGVEKMGWQDSVSVQEGGGGYKNHIGIYINLSPASINNDGPLNNDQHITITIYTSLYIVFRKLINMIIYHVDW